MEAALRHAKARAEYLNKCSSTYIIHIAIKELGIASTRDGFYYVKNSVRMLCENPNLKLKNEVYLAVAMTRDPPAEEDQVENAMRKVIMDAWSNRDPEIWECYFPIGETGKTECPSNREFLFAIVDYVELWKAFCEEVNHGK